jgi:hypothetical protein
MGERKTGKRNESTILTQLDHFVQRKSLLLAHHYLANTLVVCSDCIAKPVLRIFPWPLISVFLPAKWTLLLFWLAIESSNCSAPDEEEEEEVEEEEWEE